MSAHAADLAELQELVDRMSAAATAIGLLADDVAAHDRALHTVWAGRSSQAHLDRQHVWHHRAADMHDALTALRAHVGQARANYAWAVESNVRMWEQLR